MHTSLYRKYRSHTFSEMVGQSHIVTILSNAITHNRLSHAYIFSGPRGTGKTSTARILAKALNCRNGATPTPCMTCDLCLKITAGQAVDVIEIDAASHTGVDNIRTLNDQVNFSPVECRVKFYIIDEAHMLSSGAFNALLK
ncbi:MAG: AAA family ATPase, partial [Candidatus Margulisiibacteriota bacterium]